MNNDKEFLATEPIGKLLLRLAIPTLAAQMIMSYNYGAKNADRVKGTFFLLLKASLTYSVILFSVQFKKASSAIHTQ